MILNLPIMLIIALSIIILFLLIYIWKRRNELDLNTVFDNIPDAILVLDVNNEVVKINSSAKTLFGVDVFHNNIHELKSTDYSEKEFKKGEKTYFGRKKPIINATGNYSGALIIINDITKQKQLEEILLKSRENYKEIIDGMNDTAWIIDFNFKFIDANKAAVKKLGYSRKELLSVGPEDIDPNLSKEIIRNLIKEMPKDKIQTFETKHRTKTGKIIPVEIVSSLVNYQGKQAILSIARDITQRKKSEEALRQSQEEFSSLFQSNPEATVYTDKDGIVININPKFTELFGYTLEEFKGKSIDSGLIQPPERIGEAKKYTQKAILDGYVAFETVRKKKDGTLIPVFISGSPVIVNNDVKGTIAVFYDISDRIKMEKQLKRLSRIDTLTRTLNRRYGMELILRQLKLSKRNSSPLLLSFVDINNFKAINDKYGHQEGDKVLKEIAEIFKTTIRETDILCRIGGDEFLLAFPHNSLEDAPKIKKRLEKNLTKYNKESRKEYQVNLSMGFSEYTPEKPKTLDALIAIADKQMYKEKSEKNNE
ncbi:MAG: PAS domain S-box protein [Candidatus Caldatribacteriota bacterium]